MVLLNYTDSGVMCLTLNRPSTYNAFNREMALTLQDLLDQGAEDEDVRAILLTGEGKAFCSGQDLSEAIDPEGPGLDRILSEHYNPLVRKMRALPKPIVVAVNGVAAGAGANLALAGDVVVAAENASFIQAFSKIGLIPDTGGTLTLPRLVGPAKASAWMMLGDKISGTEAERAGMIYKAFPAEDLQVRGLEACRSAGPNAHPRFCPDQASTECLHLCGAGCAAGIGTPATERSWTNARL